MAGTRGALEAKLVDCFENRFLKQSLLSKWGRLKRVVVG